MRERPSSAGLALLETLDRMGVERDGLRSRVEELEAHIQTLTLPAATPISVKEFVKKHPSYNEGGLRWLLFHRRTNGLEAAVIRHGRRLLIDERKFFEWEARHREALARSLAK